LSRLLRNGKIIIVNMIEKENTMAEQQHLDLLRQGKMVWNVWREAHQHIQPDLSAANLDGMSLDGANLSGAHLSGASLIMTILHHANFRDADLSGANLINAQLVNTNFSGAYLNKANLGHANLTGANLTGANLTGANLNDTNLINADLRSADLTGASLVFTNLSSANLGDADLRKVNLSDARLSETNLSDARVGMTTFGRLDLSVTRGLETVQHRSPSIIGIDTIYMSQGRIPEIFLRGTGAPESFIEYMRSLVARPIEYYTSFLSYSSQDQNFAQRLYADLQSRGVRCWFAPEDLKIGDHYHQHIDEAIRLYDKFVLILSEHAVQSARVEREVMAAREKEDHLGHEVLFPIRLDDAVMTATKAWAADMRRRWHIGDFTQWKQYDAYQRAFERLLRDLKAGPKPLG
jgi:uncharacterized protein YjbI with pentapeptide repeats